MKKTFFHKGLALRALVLAGLVHGVLGLAQSVPEHAEGLHEELISVELESGRKQLGVFSSKLGTSGHTHLAVLLPGYPSVVRPVVQHGVMTSARLTGNFLIRSRRHLANDAIATLVVDCHSDSGDECRSAYQASNERQKHVQKLIEAVKEKAPSLQKVWLIGTSMGTISSSFMPLYDASAYAGAIHTASITEPYANNSYSVLANFDYAKARIPQFFVHHKNDPCRLTTYAGAQKITRQFNLPLITVTGGSGFRGDACQAHTEHGFKGRESDVMKAIAVIITTGQAGQMEF